VHDIATLFAHHRSMRWHTIRRDVLTLLLAGMAGFAFAQAPPPPPPPGSVVDCPVTAFGEATAQQYQQGISGRCLGESTRWLVETPKAKPTDVGPSVMKAEFTSLTPLPQLPFTSTLRLDWAGLRGSVAAGNPRSERAGVSLGSLVRLLDNVAVQTNVGFEQVGVLQRSRATVSSVWQPTKLGVLFAEWAGTDDGNEVQRLGGRVWIVPRTLSLDLGVRKTPELPGWVNPRIGLALYLPM
jgi:hypothetical protein